jgi:hypothetical protein
VGTGSTTYIGCETAEGSFFNGYISNLRVIKGTAVYTTTFTPSTTPLTAIANTSLLTCQSPRFIDNSINNLTITKNGDTSVQRFSPFNPASVTPTSYSGYFDGTGDYLNYTGGTTTTLSGDYTFECWVYLNNLSASQPMICIGDDYNLGLGFFITTSGKINLYGNAASIYTSTGSTVVVNTWTHIAVVRSGSTITGYINGVAQSTATNSSQYSGTTTYIGRETYNTGYATSFSGYLSNVRLVKGVAVYTGAFTVPTSPLTATQSSSTNIAAITGTSTSLLTCQSTTFIDNSTNNFTITANGNSQPTQQNPFGFTSATTNGYTVSTIGGSGYFDGSDYLTIPSSTAFAFASGVNFTVEGWVYLTSYSPGSITGGALIGTTGGFTSGWYINLGQDINSLRITSNASGTWTDNITVTTGNGVPLNVWTHIAFVRNGGSLVLYKNGVSVASMSGASAYNFTSPNNSAYIGHDSDGTYARYVTGSISDVRVVKGTVLYTSNFVPPSAPLTAIQNTVLLTNMTSAGISDAAMMNNMETVGDAKLSTAISKFGGSSMYFDGTGDHIQAFNVQPLGSGDLTFEMWIYPLDTASRHVFSFGAGWSPANGISMIQYNGNFALSCGTGWAPANAGQAIEINGWHHIALVRNNTAVKFYYDGVLKGSGTDSSNLTATAIDIGYVFSAGAWGSFYGYIDDLRITKGYARYTSNFTPPTSALQIF